MDIAQKRVLALRAVDCPGWEDRPGMLNLHGYRLTEDDVAQGRLCGLPDFDDDATRGWLLGLVRRFAAHDAEYVREQCQRAVAFARDGVERMTARLAFMDGVENIRNAAEIERAILGSDETWHDAARVAEILGGVASMPNLAPEPTTPLRSTQPSSDTRG